MHNPLEILKEKVSHLPHSQKLVVDFILDNYLEVGFMTVEQIAHKVGTSTTTVMRLMSNAGYKGYSDFQKCLQTHISEESAPQTRFNNNLNSLSENESWLQHYELQTHQIQKANELNESIFHEAANLICSSTRIYCTSVRSGLPVSQYLTHNINRLLGNAKLTHADSSDWVDDVISFTENDVLIAVSFSRYGERILQYVNQAKNRGTKIIVITDKFSSPLVPFGDLILICPADSISSHNSIVSSIFTVDYLISILSLEKSTLISQRLLEVDNVLREMNYHAQKK